MKKIAVLVIVLSLGFSAWWFMRPRPGGVEAVIEPPAQEVSQPVTEKPQPQKEPPLLPAVTVAEAEQYVDLKRAETDIAYRRGPLMRHKSIKEYLASPIKGTPLVDSVIDFLLVNGFSLDDLQIAYVGLMFLDADYPTREKFERMFADTTPEKRERWLKKAQERHWEFAPATLGMMAQTDDPVLIQELINLAPAEGKPLGPARENIPILEPVDGERLLTDADWMTERHRAAAAKGAGQHRRTMVRPEFNTGPDPEAAKLAFDGLPIGRRVGPDGRPLR
ncbi:MAG: hypothetical protein AB9869_03515 [Verrucomicrobiia bacterium]